ncbi:MAG: hypothetical protein ACM3S4_01745 [Burkholderiales bacterium]
MVAVDWFAKSFGIEPAIAPDSQTALARECMLLLGLLAALASTMPLLVLLTRTRFFAPVVQPVNTRSEMLLTRQKRWKTALVAILISGVSYPFITQLGHGLMPLPESIFRMTAGNGVITWFLFLLQHRFSLCMAAAAPFQRRQGMAVPYIPAVLSAVLPYQRRRKALRTAAPKRALHPCENADCIVAAQRRLS